MARRFIDLLGQTFGLLTVRRLLTVSNQGNRGTGKATTWECVCECGKTKTVTTSNLRVGNVRSCGCLQTLKKRGAGNLRWKGGRFITSSGYVAIRCYDYDRPRQILEHSYVMEKHL